MSMLTLYIFSTKNQFNLGWKDENIKLKFHRKPLNMDKRMELSNNFQQNHFDMDKKMEILILKPFWNKN